MPPFQLKLEMKQGCVWGAESSLEPSAWSLLFVVAGCKYLLQLGLRIAQLLSRHNCHWPSLLNFQNTRTCRTHHCQVCLASECRYSTSITVAQRLSLAVLHRVSFQGLSLGALDMGQQQCLHWKSSVLVIAVSMNCSMIGTGLWSAQPLTLPWTSDPIAKLHYLFSKAYFIAELLRCHVMEEEKEATRAGKEQMYPMRDHAPSFTQFVLIHHGDFTADAFQG